MKTNVVQMNLHKLINPARYICPSLNFYFISFYIIEKTRVSCVRFAIRHSRTPTCYKNTSIRYTMISTRQATSRWISTQMRRNPIRRGLPHQWTIQYRSMKTNWQFGNNNCRCQRKPVSNVCLIVLFCLISSYKMQKSVFMDVKKSVDRVSSIESWKWRALE